MHKLITLLFFLLFLSCTPGSKKNKAVIAEVSEDSLAIDRVDVIQVSNYNNVISDLNNSVESSIEAWNKSPELGQKNRIKSIEIVAEKFRMKLNAVEHQKDDKVKAYRFIKSYNKKRYVGHTVVLFAKSGQKTILYYDIEDYSKSQNYPTGIKQLINKGLVRDINALELKYKNTKEVYSTSSRYGI